MPDPLADELTLTRGERDRLVAGDYAALKREEHPGEVGGQRIPLLRRNARRMPVYGDAKFSGHRREIVGTTETPEYWALWIELEKPKRHRKGHWQIQLIVHDERQASRILRAGGPPGPPREAGLRTRKPEKPRKKGEGVGSFTDETARGYGGGGAQALDHGGVDDDELKRQRAKADERWEEHLRDAGSETERRRKERAVKQRMRETMRRLGPVGQAELLANLDQEISRADEDLAA